MCVACGQPIAPGQSWYEIKPSPRVLGSHITPGPRHVSCPRRAEVERHVRFGRKGWHAPDERTPP